MLRQFHDITHVMYINLDSRMDRRAHFEPQFTKLGLKIHRVQHESHRVFRTRYSQ